MKPKHVIVGIMALLLLGSALAVAAFFGSNTVADFLGAGGRTFTKKNGAVSTDPVENRVLTVFAKKDTSVSPQRICGTINYKAFRGLPCNHIYRFKYEIKDPDSSNWATVLNVTEPDSRISNPQSGEFNTFQASYYHADASRGLAFRATIWESSSDGNPMVMELGMSQP